MDKENEISNRIEIQIGSIDAEKYNIVAKNSSLLNIQLISSDFDVLPKFFSHSGEMNIELCHEVLSLEITRKLAAGIFRYAVVAKVGRKHVLTIKAVFMVVYNVPDKSPEEEAKAFCARVGLFAAYPYFRSLVANYTSSANLDLPILPVLSADPIKDLRGKQTTVRRSTKKGKEKSMLV